MSTTTANKISELRTRLNNALASGESTVELRAAIAILERKTIKDREELAAKQERADQERAKAIQMRSAELAHASIQAVCEAAKPFSLKD